MAFPKFLYDSRFDDATPVASSTAAGDYAVANLTDWRPYTWWKPAAAPSTVTVDSGSAKSRDYLLVYGDAGTYEARGSTDNFGASDVLLGTLTLAKTGLGLVTFAPQAHRYTRLKIAAGTPALAIAAIGAALVSPVYLDGQFDPTGRTAQGEANRNENGQPLGRAIDYEQWAEQILLKNVSWSWIDGIFLPAWEAHLRSTPFGFAWEADAYPDQVRLVVADDKLDTPRRAGSYGDVGFGVSGVL